MHELADDRVYGSVELLHVLCRACELGDAGERDLHVLGSAAFGLGRLQVRQPPPRLGELGREVDVASYTAYRAR
ncbi:MAG: hypothetical protein M3304_09080 [Actinomycetota bacterium]|nr:hypothetical protein [Actinomycetota bacterium]